ncbi:MAG: hypothetical protein ACYCV7_16115, partial [Acidimicrobiales bacterium]
PSAVTGLARSPAWPLARVEQWPLDMLQTACGVINLGAVTVPDGLVHRLDKFDTVHGLVSVRHAAQEHVPYAVLLHERFLGRPYASHRDAVSELVGDVMESAIEAKITGDDGTARDKVARILRLAHMRDERETSDQTAYQVIACIDGRGFGVRQQDCRDLLRPTRGKVFSANTLGDLIAYSDLVDFVP